MSGPPAMPQGVGAAQPSRGVAPAPGERIECICGDAHGIRIPCVSCLSTPMIQCDRCIRWLHLPCLRMKDTDVPLTGEFLCPECASATGRPRTRVRVKVRTRRKTPMDATAHSERVPPPLKLQNLSARAEFFRARWFPKAGFDPAKSACAADSGCSHFETGTSQTLGAPAPGRTVLQLLLASHDLLDRVFAYSTFREVARVAAGSRRCRDAVAAASCWTSPKLVLADDDAPEYVSPAGLRQFFCPYLRRARPPGSSAAPPRQLVADYCFRLTSDDVLAVLDALQCNSELALGVPARRLSIRFCQQINNTLFNVLKRSGGMLGETVEPTTGDRVGQHRPDNAPSTLRPRRHGAGARYAELIGRTDESPCSATHDLGIPSRSVSAALFLRSLGHLDVSGTAIELDAPCIATLALHMPHLVRFDCLYNSGTTPPSSVAAMAGIAAWSQVIQILDGAVGTTEANPKSIACVNWLGKSLSPVAAEVLTCFRQGNVGRDTSCARKRARLAGAHALTVDDARALLHSCRPFPSLAVISAMLPIHRDHIDESADASATLVNTLVLLPVRSSELLHRWINCQTEPLPPLLYTPQSTITTYYVPELVSARAWDALHAAVRASVDVAFPCVDASPPGIIRAVAAVLSSVKASLQAPDTALDADLLRRMSEAFSPLYVAVDPRDLSTPRAEAANTAHFRELPPATMPPCGSEDVPWPPRRLVERAAALSDRWDTVPEAIATMEAAVDATPDARLHLYTAWLCDKLYRWEDSQKHCDAAITLAPECGSACVQLAGLHAQTGTDNIDVIDSWLDRGEASSDFLPGAYHHIFEERGVLRLREGFVLDAFDALRIALQFAPARIDGDARIAEQLRTTIERILRSINK